MAQVGGLGGAVDSVPRMTLVERTVAAGDPDGAAPAMQEHLAHALEQFEHLRARLEA